jgi:hypothetical protein
MGRIGHPAPEGCKFDLPGNKTDSECLDWQNSQFINIVGKDDISAAIEVKAWRLRDIHVSSFRRSLVA